MSLKTPRMSQPHKECKPLPVLIQKAKLSLQGKLSIEMLQMLGLCSSNSPHRRGQPDKHQQRKIPSGLSWFLLGTKCKIKWTKLQLSLSKSQYCRQRTVKIQLKNNTLPGMLCNSRLQSIQLEVRLYQHCMECMMSTLLIPSTSQHHK